MKITFSISGIIGFSIILILLSIIFQRLYKQNNIFEKFDNQNDIKSPYDYIMNTVDEIKKKDETINNLENDFIIPTFTDYYELYKKTKDKINDNNLPLDKFIIDQHLQDTQISKLKNEISNLNYLINLDNNNNQNNQNNCPHPLNRSDKAIKSVKSLKYGISLNTHQQSNTGNKPSEPQNLPNGCQSYPTYEPVNPETDPLMIYINQGCLTYSIDGKNISDDSRKDNYWVEMCQKGKPEQLFKIKQIKNNQDYNSIMSDKRTHLSDDSSTTKIYPFNVIQPKDNNNSCLTINKNGLSVENCLFLKKDDQEWKISPEKRPC